MRNEKRCTWNTLKVKRSKVKVKMVMRRSSTKTSNISSSLNVTRKWKCICLIGNRCRRSEWRGQMFNRKFLNSCLCACAVKKMPFGGHTVRSCSPSLLKPTNNIVNQFYMNSRSSIKGRVYVLHIEWNSWISLLCVLLLLCRLCLAYRSLNVSAMLYIGR